MLARPERSEYADFYANYVAGVPDGDLLAFMAAQPGTYRKLLGSLSEADACKPPAPGKWNVKQVVGHICDAERVQSYRALRFARADQKELHGFEQDDYVREAHSDSRQIAELLDEFQKIRESSMAMFRSFTPEWWTRTGVANGAPVSVRAMAYIIAGHTKHHYDLLQKQFGGKASGATK